MRRIYTTQVILIALGLLARTSAAADPPCRNLQGVKLERMLEYLQGNRQVLDSACITYAIRQLGTQKYEAAAVTLVTYLDYEIPGYKKPEIVVRIPTLGDQYPATTALFEIGKVVSPLLIRAIADSGSSELVRNNALQALFDVHRENVVEAVILLRKASRSATDAAESNRLWDAARKQAAMCHGELRVRCEEARLEQDER